MKITAAAESMCALGPYGPGTCLPISCPCIDYQIKISESLFQKFYVNDFLRDASLELPRVKVTDYIYSSH